MRPTFGREYIENEFRRIGVGLSEPLTVFLIGGGAMSLRDLKGATKDIDLVVPDGDAYGQLWAVLIRERRWVSPRHLQPAGREQARAYRWNGRAQRAVPRSGSIDSPAGYAGGM